MPPQSPPSPAPLLPQSRPPQPVANTTLIEVVRFSLTQENSRRRLQQAWTSDLVTGVRNAFAALFSIQVTEVVATISGVVLDVEAFVADQTQRAQMVSVINDDTGILFTTSLQDQLTLQGSAVTGSFTLTSAAVLVTIVRVLAPPSPPPQQPQVVTLRVDTSAASGAGGGMGIGAAAGGLVLLCCCVVGWRQHRRQTRSSKEADANMTVKVPPDPLPPGLKVLDPMVMEPKDTWVEEVASPRLPWQPTAISSSRESEEKTEYKLANQKLPSKDVPQSTRRSRVPSPKQQERASSTSGITSQLVTSTSSPFEAVNESPPEEEPARVGPSTTPAKANTVRISTHAFDNDGDESRLSFTVGTRINVIEEGEPGGWWLGSVGGEEGWFASNFTMDIDSPRTSPRTWISTGMLPSPTWTREIVKELGVTQAKAKARSTSTQISTRMLPSPTWTREIVKELGVTQAKAKARSTSTQISTYAFDNDGDESRLSFPAGAIIEVVKEGEPGGWWLGLMGSKEGWFPQSFTEAEAIPRDEASPARRDSCPPLNLLLSTHSLPPPVPEVGKQKHSLTGITKAGVTLAEELQMREHWLAGERWRRPVSTKMLPPPMLKKLDGKKLDEENRTFSSFMEKVSESALADKTEKADALAKLRTDALAAVIVAAKAVAYSEKMTEAAEIVGEAEVGPAVRPYPTRTTAEHPDLSRPQKLPWEVAVADVVAEEVVDDVAAQYVSAHASAARSEALMEAAPLIRVATHAWPADGTSAEEVSETHLAFTVGDRIEVMEQGEPNGWWYGCVNKSQGWFAVSFTRPDEQESGSSSRAVSKFEAEDESLVA